MAKIKSFGVMKMSAFMTILGVLIGLVFSVIAWLLVGLLAGLAPTFADLFPVTIPSFKPIYFLLLPLSYGALGFVSGLVLTPLLNLILKIIGGLNVNLDMTEKTA